MKLGFWLALGGGIVLLGGGLWLLPLFTVFNEAPLPSDEAMLRNFYAHRPELEHLVTLAKVGKPDACPACLRALGSERGVFVEKTGIKVSHSAQGMSFAGSTEDKGYLFSETTPSPLVSTLNENSDPDAPSFERYRRIEGGWYLYYRWSPN